MEKIYRNNLYKRITEDKRLRETVYLIAFALILISGMLGTTMFDVYISQIFKKVVSAVSLGLLLMKIFIMDKYSLKQLSIITLVEAIIFIAWRISGYNAIVNISLLIAGAKDVSFKKILKTYLCIVISITIIAMLAAWAGIIEHIVYYRDGKYRYAFGSIYCTDFASHIFYIILAYGYLKEGLVKYYDILVFILLGCFTYYYCDARLDSICIFGASLFFIYYAIRNKYKKNKDSDNKLNFIKKLIFIFSVPAATIISIVTTIFYNPSNSIFNSLNKILTNRLKYGKLGIDRFGFKLFGQNVPMNGNGNVNKLMEDYFFLDCSFLSIALRYGIIIIFMVCIYYMVVNYKLVESGDYLLPALICFVVINSVVAHHFLEIAYNPFLVCLLADMKYNSIIIKEKVR